MSNSRARSNSQDSRSRSPRSRSSCSQSLHRQRILDSNSSSVAPRASVNQKGSVPWSKEEWPVPKPVYKWEYCVKHGSVLLVLLIWAGIVFSKDTAATAPVETPFQVCMFVEAFWFSVLWLTTEFGGMVMMAKPPAITHPNVYNWCFILSTNFCCMCTFFFLLQAVETYRRGQIAAIAVEADLLILLYNARAHFMVLGCFGAPYEKYENKAGMVPDAIIVYASLAACLHQYFKM